MAQNKTGKGGKKEGQSTPKNAPINAPDCPNKMPQNKRKNYPTQESICWNCKRALNSPNCRCSWSKDLVPVPGWETIPGGKQVDGERAPIVISCPKFVKYHEFTTMKEAMKPVCEYLGRPLRGILNHLYYWLGKYEIESGNKVPGWVMWAAQEKAGVIEKLPKEGKEEE